MVMLHQHRRRTGWRCYGGLYSKGGGKSPPQTPSRRAYRRRTETSKGNVSRRNKRRVRREHRRAYRSRKSRGEARGHIRAEKATEKRIKA